VTFARTLAEVFGDDVVKHRALASKGALDNVAVTFSVERANGWESATALIRDKADVVDGNVSLPGLPFVHIIASEEALRTLFSGKGDVAAMAMLGEVRVEGDVTLLNELAACFKTGQSPLSVRLQR
jgi:hypothetical protein